ncbi:serine/threonine-protein kinase [Fodinicola acaciae]|uniref:serine/threonine-protein kinase n=1 Tax=Fodinicola acaciae TaxID=2681555 RepID=UPI0013D61A5D|nr:serine/threonine-protein kinase [Fodinicola acaciae]
MFPLDKGDPAELGGYELLGRLGAGGMGVVYLGRLPGGRLVAIKVVRSRFAQDPEFRERFRREVAAARAVSGAFTAAVIDADPDAERPWLVTEYVPGMPLDEAIAVAGPLPPDSLRTLAGGLAEALRSIHATGLVHRDLKPSNVLLTMDGPRVIDFGISRAMDASKLTQTGFVVGSPGFMSPEQAVGQPVDAASDVFSYGGVLAYASTGREPFGGDGGVDAQLYRTVVTDPRLDDLAGSWIAPIVQACLEKEAARRPTAAQLLDMLAAAPAASPGNWLPPALVGAIAQKTQQGEIVRQAAEKIAAERRRTSRRAGIRRAIGTSLGAVAVVGVLSLLGVLLFRQNQPPPAPEWSGVRISTTPLYPPNPGGWGYTRPARISMPHASVGVAWSATGDELDTYEARDLHVPAVRAKQGQKLLVAAIDPMVTYAAFSPDQKNPVVARLLVGDQPTVLTGLPLPDRSSTTQVIVVGAAPATPVRLQLADAGRTAEIDLRTGKVIADPYAQHQSDVDWSGDAQATGVFDGRTLPVSVSVTTPLSGLKAEVASISNYRPERGWAPAGQAFLSVPMPNVTTTDAFYSSVGLYLVNDAQAFTFRPTGGAAITADRHDRAFSTIVSLDKNDSAVVFTVPATVTGGTVTFDLGKSRLDKTKTNPWRHAPAFNLRLSLNH